MTLPQEFFNQYDRVSSSAKPQLGWSEAASALSSTIRTLSLGSQEEAADWPPATQLQHRDASVTEPGRTGACITSGGDWDLAPAASCKAAVHFSTRRRWSAI
jgi:hypothetical protein